MLRRLSSPKDLTEQEIQSIIRPSLLGVLVLSLLLGGFALVGISKGEQQNRVLFIACLGLTYGSFILFVLIRYRPSFEYTTATRISMILIHAGLSVFAVIVVPASLLIFPAASILLAILLTSILWGRQAAYSYVILVLLGLILLSRYQENLYNILPGILSVAVLTVSIVEFIRGLLKVNLQHIEGLKTVNDFARRINSTIEQEEVLKILVEAISRAIKKVDTCFLAIQVNQEKLYLHLTYDGGEYFPPQEKDMEGTLSGWVIRNQRSLFIADLQKDVNLDGVQVVLTGNNRNSATGGRSPIALGQSRGVLAVASYMPNAFDSTDLELLENLAQHTALAIDNANHHSQVEAQARLDSLTGAYNHGHIVQMLEQELKKARLTGKQMSIIMLDVDYFKQYNDTFGHKIGDEVLVNLAQAIKQNIKSTDAVGRWGGEEFTIVLPNTNGAQATKVALRLQETVRRLSLHPKNEKTLPFPTISQGVAVFPTEAADSDTLIQLADRRLYIAKQRGRNQVEPAIEHWETAQNTTKNGP